MTTATIRQRLITFLEDAEESKVKAVYTLLEKDIEDSAFQLDEEQLRILDKERAMYLSGQDRSYSKMEAIDLIKSGKKTDV